MGDADEGVVDARDEVGGFLRDLHAVVGELGGAGPWAGFEEGEGFVAVVAVLGEMGDGDLLEGFAELAVEVVNPELVEVREDDVLGAVGDEFEPVVKGLLVVLGEVLAAPLHLNEEATGPDEVGELGAPRLAVFGGGFDPQFVGAAGFEGVAVPEGAHEAVHVELGLALLIAFEVSGEGGEFAEGFAGGGHGVGFTPVSGLSGGVLGFLRVGRLRFSSPGGMSVLSALSRIPRFAGTLP